MIFLEWKLINVKSYLIEICSLWQTDIMSALAKIMAWCQTGNKPLSDPVSLAHICATICFNELCNTFRYDCHWIVYTHSLVIYFSFSVTNIDLKYNPCSKFLAFLAVFLTSGSHMLLETRCQNMLIHFLHDDVNKWKHLPFNRPFVRGIHRRPVDSPHKGQ